MKVSSDQQAINLVPSFIRYCECTFWSLTLLIILKFIPMFEIIAKSFIMYQGGKELFSKTIHFCKL